MNRAVMQGDGGGGLEVSLDSGPEAGSNHQSRRFEKP